MLVLFLFASLRTHIYWRLFSSCLSRWVCWFCWLNVLTSSFFLFSIGFNFQLVSLSLWTYYFWKIFFVSWLGLSYDESFILVSSYGSTISLVQVLWFALALCNLALVVCSRNAHFMEELILYWPSKIFLSFRQSMPMGNKFRGCKGIWFYAFVWILSICL